MPSDLARPAPTKPTRPTRLLCVFFVAALLAPWWDMLRRPAALRGPEVEGRASTPVPKLALSRLALQRFPGIAEHAFADRLGFRDVLLRWHSLLTLQVFEHSPAKDVLLGKQGWMFYTGENSLPAWRGLMPLRESELVVWQHAIEARRDRAREFGTQYALVIAPNKESIYPDFLPEGYEPLHETRLDQLTAWMRTHSDVLLIDLRPALRAARREDTPGHYLYLEEGTHWHGRGCMSGASEILKRLSALFPVLANQPGPGWTLQSQQPAESWRTKMYLPAPLDRVRDEWTAPGGKAHAGLKGIADSSGRRYEQDPPRPELPRVLLFHDSFGPGVERILAEHFRSLRMRQGYDFDEATLAAEPQELLLEIFVERILANFDPAHFAPPARAAGAAPGPLAPARRFEASQDVRWCLDPRAIPSGLTTNGPMQVVLGPTKPMPGLLLTTTSSAGALDFPVFPAGPARDLLLKLVIDSPIATSAELFYRDGEDSAWSPERGVSLALVRGRNTCWPVLPASARVRQLRLRPTREAGRTFVLRALELRGVD